MEVSTPTSNSISNLISKLHPLERKVLPILKIETKLEQICQKAKMDETEVLRALQWLENKQALTINSQKKKIVLLDKNGQMYKKDGLPEKIFLSQLDEQFKGLNVLTKKSKLSREEINACLGVLKRKLAIDTQKGEFLQIKITERGRKIMQEPSMEENFLARDFPLDLEQLSDTEKFVLEEFKKRKEMVKVEEQKNTTIILTELGRELASADLSGEVVNRLTVKMLKDGSWKDKNFRSYDVEINVPKIFPGKKHFVTQSVEYAKQVWIDMGFKEMTGNMATASFWCFDALFMPQNHPAREMQDTFFLGGKAEKGRLPSAEMIKKIKGTHENGGSTGSKGWQYQWSEEESKKNILRTHTTVLSARTLASLKQEDLPAKFFALGKNFRNEALDWKHLFEFNQTEGIVVDENVTFRHLLGYLKQFFRKMGFPQARFRPAYFPYTEPSVEIDVFHPERKEWVEIGGAGVFRPEVVQPLLGKDIPVLAWGPGFDRIILDYYKISDIRDLYKNDLKQLREMKAWMK
ncbi:phenylalanine--tRNA ligase subunit alpha [Candidatus Woesearchaeota archaeon]|nr:phenylalanine--tRNA ligase subunit alpha [Candidatus Woesearchaeota archaeon]